MFTEDVGLHNDRAHENCANMLWRRSLVRAKESKPAAARHNTQQHHHRTFSKACRVDANFA